MSKKIASLSAAVVAAILFCSAPSDAQAASNEAVTRQQLASLLSGTAGPQLAELTMFFTMMPKGGDLHHHYSGSVYAEQYLEWIDKQNYCVSKESYHISVDPELVAAERRKPLAERTCLSGEDVMNNDTVLARLLQRWSDKDFYNHTSMQSPPDRQFFDTFLYFNPVASTNGAAGLQRLKQRAIRENLSYIETIYEIAPDTQDANFDQKALSKGISEPDLVAFVDKLDKDAEFQAKIAAYLDNLNTSSTGIDDASFTMRYMPYALRFLTPSQVFSQMVASFKLASSSPLIVGANIVGQESVHVAMRDYGMHMQMYQFLKSKYPDVKLSMHAGELALGTVPPEGLASHIKEAIDIAGASRIGHGLDIVHETDPLGTIKKMREKQIAVEINISSNQFILGIKDAAHPVTMYRKYGVPYVLATDDAGVSRNNLSSEYVLYATRYQPAYAEVKKLSYDSIRYSFLADKDKQRLLKALDVKYSKFEADIATSQRQATGTR